MVGIEAEDIRNATFIGKHREKERDEKSKRNENKKEKD